MDRTVSVLFSQKKYVLWNLGNGKWWGLCLEKTVYSTTDKYRHRELYPPWLTAFLRFPIPYWPHGASCWYVEKLGNKNNGSRLFFTPISDHHILQIVRWLYSSPIAVHQVVIVVIFSLIFAPLHCFPWPLSWDQNGSSLQAQAWIY